MSTIYGDHHHALPEAPSTATLPSTARLAAAASTLQDKPPIMGIAYQCEYASEEETGAEDLTRIFRSTADPTHSVYRREWDIDNPGHRTHFTQADYALLTDEALCLSTRPVGATIETQVNTALRSLGTRLHGVHDDSVAALRREAIARKIPGRSRMDRYQVLEALTRARITAAEPSPEHPAWFRYGNLLVLPRTPDAFGAVVNRLVAAIDAGALTVSGCDGVFSQGLLFSDARDLSTAEQQRIHQMHEQHREDMATLAPVRERMLERGHGMWALGRPRRGDDDVTRYWLNGHTMHLEGGVTGQPCGWYTLEELDEQKYVEDLRRAKAPR